jgi:hypothetical protein
LHIGVSATGDGARATAIGDDGPRRYCVSSIECRVEDLGDSLLPDSTQHSKLGTQHSFSSFSL